jgi:hypothetical protein
MEIVGPVSVVQQGSDGLFSFGITPFHYLQNKVSQFRRGCPWSTAVRQIAQAEQACVSCKDHRQRDGSYVVGRAARGTRRLHNSFAPASDSIGTDTDASSDDHESADNSPIFPIF